jgi:hypothetical protein
LLGWSVVFSGANVCSGLAASLQISLIWSIRCLAYAQKLSTDPERTPCCLCMSINKHISSFIASATLASASRSSTPILSRYDPHLQDDQFQLYRKLVLKFLGDRPDFLFHCLQRIIKVIPGGLVTLLRLLVQFCFDFLEANM